MGDDSDRRQFFRLEDEAVLTVRVVSEELHASLAARPEEEWEGDGSVVARIGALTTQTGTILAAIRKSDPDVGHYLAILDKKIDLLARALEGGRHREKAGEGERITIGAGGVDYHAAEALNPGTRLEIDLLFLPSRLHIHAYGTVVDCVRDDAEPDRPFRIGAAFTLLSAIQREAIVRHVLARQSALLRKSRHSDE